MEDLLKLTELLWKVYILGGNEEESQIIDNLFAQDCVIIGTGRHEFYKNLSEFQEALAKEMVERQEIQFCFKDFWCEEKKAGPDVSLVYGGLYIWWESEDKTIYINMESRFSILYQRRKDEWKIVHIHQSMPNLEQADDEYYPKTLSEQVKESHAKIEELKVLAERDSLTNLINFRTFKECYENWIFDRTWLFVLDIDKFKQINDTYGHLTGNYVLQIIASALEGMVRSSDIVCRMGGDEFIILCNGFDTEEKAREFVQRMQKKIADAIQSKIHWTGVSVGMTRAGSDEMFEKVMNRADEDLYTKKHTSEID